MQNLTNKGYEVIEEIGSGGFGVVYRAHQSSAFNREVAIKVIRPQFANVPDYIRRFEREAQIISLLQHPHIVPLIDFWRDPDGAYLVMGWLRGGNLNAMIESDPIDIETTGNILNQICAGLEAAHQSGVIHRDIKPSNVLLDEYGNAYVADFGIAKDLMLTSREVTEADAVVGSPGYLSPEQARGEIVTPRTDVYSLGVMLYEMLAGEHPFAGSHAVDKMYKHLNEQLPFLDTLDSNVKDAINDVIQMATAKNPAERYATAIDFVTAYREAAKLGFATAQSIVEALTRREQEILQLIIDGKSNKEIAAELFIAVGTVRWHIRQIYGKLNVRSRVQAIVKARELQLIVSDGNGKTAAQVDTTYFLMPEPENPYKGLNAFTSADSSHFFGRDSLINKLLTRLEEDVQYKRFMAVLGPSGSGKSSLVKAGLIPAIWRGDIPESDNWYVVEMLPGAYPLDELEVALTRVAADQGQNLMEHLERDARGLVRIGQLILPDDDSELLIVIDQFEEVFTLVEDEARRSHFLDLIYMAVTDPRSRVRVVVTLRADFYDRPLQYPQFGEMLRNRMETILPLSADELEAAIVKPARQVGVKFADGLVSTIVADVNYQPGALPLLQYALTELFERRDGRVITHEAYQAVGGTTGAIARRADSLFEEMNEEGQAAARQIFLRLVTLGEGTEDTRRRVERSELLAIADDEDLVNDIIDAYAGYRLLALDHDPSSRAPTVEVAHEAILREWERLRGWLNESREDIKTQRQMALAAQTWDEQSRDPSYLATGKQLHQFEEWANETTLRLTPLEEAFLDFSLTEQTEREAETEAQRAREAHLERRAANRLRYLAATFAIGLIIALGLATFAFDQQNRALTEAENSETQAALAFQNAATAEASLRVAQRVQALFLADLSRQALERGKNQLALLLALEALQNHPEVSPGESRNALLEAMSSQLGPEALLQHDDSIRGAAWNADETRILSWSIDGTARVWDAHTEQEIFRLQHGGLVQGAQWNADETRILSWSNDGTARVWDARSGQLILTLLHDGIVRGAQWSSDESRVLTWAQDNTLRIWNTQSGDEQQRFEHDDHVWGAQWNSSETLILSWSRDNSAHVWDASTGDERFTMRHDGTVLGAMWNSNETRIVSWSRDNTAQLWDARTGDNLFTLQHDDEVTGVRWNTTDLVLLTWSKDGKARAWSTILGIEGYRVRHEDSVLGARWNADETQLMAWSEDKTVRVWEAGWGGNLLLTLQHDDSVLGAQWDSTENFILTWSADGTARIWSTETGAAVITNWHDDVVSGASWNQDESAVLTWSRDNTARIWDAQSGAHVYLLRNKTEFDGVQWSQDAQMVLTWAADGTVGVWNVQTGEQVLLLEHDGPVIGAQWNQDETTILSWSGDDTARIWDAVTGDMLALFQHDGSVAEAIWNEDESLVLTRSFDGTARLWDAQTSENFLILEHTNTKLLSGISWNADETRILTWGANRTLVWDAVNGQRLLTLEHYGPVRGAAWNANDTLILTWSTDDRARIWDAQTGKQLHLFEHDNNVSGAAWSADETRLLTWSTDTTARVWDTRTDEELVVVEHAVLGATWNRDEILILTWSGDNIVRVWDAKTGEERLHLVHGGRVKGATWNRDETLILTWSGDNIVRVWDALTGMELLVLEHESDVQIAQWDASEDFILTWSSARQIRIWNSDFDSYLERGWTMTERELTNEEREQSFLPTLMPTAVLPTPTPTASS